jgi:hypothetical protein
LDKIVILSTKVFSNKPNYILNVRSFTKDVLEFQALIEQDIKENFEPMLLVANAGSYAIGQCDELKQLNETCYKHKMWIHLEGFYLSSLVLYSVPTALQVDY